MTNKPQKRHDIVERVFSDIMGYAKVAVSPSYDGDPIGRLSDKIHTSKEALEEPIRAHMKGYLSAEAAIDLQKITLKTLDLIDTYQQNYKEDESD